MSLESPESQDREEGPVVEPERDPQPHDFGVQDTKGFWDIVNQLKEDTSEE